MAQPTDIVLDGAGYMVQPGTANSPGYRRLQDGMAEGRTERISLTDFFGGMGRAIQLERDKMYSGDHVGAALNGQGLQPWASQVQTTYSALFSDYIYKAGDAPQAVVKSRRYFAFGPHLFSGPVGIEGSGAFDYTLVKTYAQNITDMCIYGSDGLLLCFGPAADILHRDIPTAVETALFAGERGWYIAEYAGYAVWNDAKTAGLPTVLRLVTGDGIDSRYIDYDPIKITTVDNALCVVTKQALYTYTGRVKEIMRPNPAWTSGGTAPTQIPGWEWSGDFTPFFQQGVYNARDDFRLLLGYGGRTIAWIAGGVHELVPNGDRAGWRSTGLAGRRFFGGCVAAGYVVVSIESYEGKNELWAYDGNAWWCIASKALTSTGAWCNPHPLGGSSANRYDLGVFREFTKDIDFIRLQDYGHASRYAYHSTAEVSTPMIDAGERDKPKAWRKIGAVFASPEIHGNTASVDALTCYLDYSIDAGQTWVQADAQNATANTLPKVNFTLDATLLGITSTFLMLRVRWASVVDYAPILVGLWAEYEILESPARRRKWNVKIHARDQEITRDGTLMTRTGRQLISDLWTAWQTDTPLTFRDIDYDDVPVQRTVRIVGINEAVEQPADSGRWGDSTITLNLVEV